MRNNSFFLLTTTACVFLSGCGSKSESLTDDDKAVLLQVFETGRFYGKGTEVLVMDTTLTTQEVVTDKSIGQDLVQFMKEYSSDGEEAIKSLNDRNKDEAPSAGLTFKLPIKYASRSETLDARQGVGAELLDKYKPSGGLNMFALPGYNKAKTLAYVYVGRMSSGQDTASRFVVCKKGPAGWKVEKIRGGIASF